MVNPYYEHGLDVCKQLDQPLQFCIHAVCTIAPCRLEALILTTLRDYCHQPFYKLIPDCCLKRLVAMYTLGGELYSVPFTVLLFRDSGLAIIEREYWNYTKSLIYNFYCWGSLVSSLVVNSLVSRY